MSETTTETTTTEDATAPEDAAEQQQQVEQQAKFTQEDIDRIISDRLKREGVAAMREKAAKYDELQEESKTEQQRSTEALQRAQAEAAEASAERDRFRAAAAHRIGEDYFDLLGSGDAETIDARAQKVAILVAAAEERDRLKAELAQLKKESKTGAPTRTPVQNLRPGATPADEQVPDNAYPAHWKR